MKTFTQLGKNKTGIDSSPDESQEMVENTEEFLGGELASIAVDLGAHSKMRSSYMHESGAMGSVPPPQSLKGMAKAGVQMLKGVRPEVFLDKLSERLAFERTGTRLYEMIIEKCKADPKSAEVVSLDQLIEFRRQEEEHFHLLVRVIRDLGGDPTVESPCADVAGVASSGIVQVMADPRTSVQQSINALVTAEATDNVGWELLIQLAEDAGADKYIKDFEQALRHEGEHLEQSRQWLQQLVKEDSKVFS